MEVKTCANCSHRMICVIYRGEMARRDYWGKDLFQELEKLQAELASKCPEYKAKE